MIFLEGMSESEAKQQAASIAKNLTVNFNRKGQIATQAGALYAFFNAAIQGTTRLAQTLRGPAGSKPPAMIFLPAGPRSVWAKRVVP